ncbi:hypothetical protein Sjap_012239 [Stephania japonica]|uniref:DUF538 domain-containing protein n=1 Tax=Stephania japonica TaxID=461633 RepID=A0AAP0IVJ1_9MAGN
MAISLSSLILYATTTLVIVHQAAAATTEVHDLLVQYGLPKGLLPNVAKSYSLSEDGEFKVELDRPCYVKFTDLTYYGTKITAKLSYGKLHDVSGIKVKKLFAWLPITGIVDSDFDTLEFQVGFLSEKLPTSMFREIPSCRASGERNGVPVDDESDVSVAASSDQWK